MRVLTAKHVIPVATRPVPNGAVAIDAGRIVAVGRRDEVLERAGADAEVEDLGRAALLPGLVNAHCHVELSWMAEDPPPLGDYADWVRGLIERRDHEDESVVRVAAERAIDFMVSRGTVAVGDIANGTSVIPLLRRSAMRGVIFHEIFDPRPGQAEQLIGRAIERLDAQTDEGDWRIVPTPHAPHTTSETLLRALAGRSAVTGEPLSIHVAESAAEVALLDDASGPFPDLFRERGLWDEAWSPPGLTPIEYLDRLGVLTERTLAVHCVHLLQRDHSKLQARGVHVVTCPRSNERLGVGIAPVPALLAEGIPVALGTDSLASAPDLDLFAEMAALRETHPKLAPAAVLRVATLNGARALGLADRLGSIEPGKLADLIVVPLAGDDDPLGELCSVPSEIRRIEASA